MAIKRIEVLTSDGDTQVITSMMRVGRAGSENYSNTNSR